MFGWLKRRDAPADTEPAKGVGAWTWFDALEGKSEPEHVVTDLGGGKYLHSWKAPTQTEAQRQAAEDSAVAAFNQSLSPVSRFPAAQRRPSVFDRPPNPDSFPS
jgi:hypothetical protein